MCIYICLFLIIYNYHYIDIEMNRIFKYFNLLIKVVLTTLLLIAKGLLVF